MNIRAQPAKTDAELGFIEAYGQNSGTLPGGADVRKARDIAIKTLETFGLPTRREEAWHYTDLKSLISSAYRLSRKPETDAVKEASERLRLDTDTVRLPFANGHFLTDLAEQLPEGVRVDAIADCAYVPSSFQASASDAIVMLNTALFSDGVCLHVQEGQKLQQPIEIDVAFKGNHGAMAATRHRVEVKKGASATFIDRCGGNDNVSYLSCSLIDLTIDEGAEVIWILSQEHGDLATRLARLNIVMQKQAQLKLFVINAGGKLVRQEIYATMAGEGADLKIRGVNLVGGSAHIDVTTSIEHIAPDANSSEVFRNITKGEGRGVFQGRIAVAQAAQQTDARMACNTLILSDSSSFSAKPELEIFADDVQCAHGATVADLDHDHLFYLMARGIPEDEARTLLVKAFVGEFFDELNNNRLSTALEARLENWLADDH